jgi:hypothetical protein
MISPSLHSRPVHSSIIWVAFILTSSCNYVSHSAISLFLDQNFFLTIPFRDNLSIFLNYEFETKMSSIFNQST